jgi:hypothetical protein
VDINANPSKLYIIFLISGLLVIKTQHRAFAAPATGRLVKSACYIAI